jgi:CRISPR/Cas system CMR-associated protein Cmr5 small subunit
LQASYSYQQLQNKVSIQEISTITQADTQLRTQYGITQSPTLILLKNGVEVTRSYGDDAATAILALINAG